MVEELQHVHSTNTLFNLSSQSLSSISSAVESLKDMLISPRPSVLKTVFWTNLKNSQETLELISKQSVDREEMQVLVHTALDSVRQLDQTSNVLFNHLKIDDPQQRFDALKLDIKVVGKYQLKALESIRKLQFLAKKESDDSFEHVYWYRNVPYYIDLVFGLIFFFSFWLLGSQVIRTLKKSIQGLMTATDTVASGQLKFVAPIFANDEFGKVTHAFNHMVERLFVHENEIKARAQTEKEHLEFLLESSIALNRSLQIEETLHQVVKSAVPYLAEWAVLDVLEEGGRIRRVKAVHSKGDLHPLLSIVEKRGPTHLSSRGIVSTVLTSGKTFIASEFSNSDESFGFLNVLGEFSGMVIPIKVRGKIKGTLSLMNSNSRRSFDEKDHLIAEDFVRRAASAIENASLYIESQEALRMRDEFLMIASHELRTPLTPLKLHLQTIERQFKNEANSSFLNQDKLNFEKLKKMIGISNRMVNRFTSLIEDLLDVSRINVGKFSLQTEEFDFVILLNEVVDRFAVELAKINCVLTVIAPVKLAGKWDQSRMEQVLVNLLSNSMRYGAGKPIEIKLEEVGLDVVLSIKDQGIGIVEKDQKRIFQRFERASPASHYGGLGLGLFVTAQILELHGGDISVKSEPGEGALFQAKFPVRSSSAVLSMPVHHLNSAVSVIDAEACEVKL